MIGIEEIGVYIPENRISNIDRVEEFGTDENFVINKIGFSHVSVKEQNEDTSDMAVKAFDDLASKIKIDKNELEVVVLVTQNPDLNIPHASAMVHKKLGLPEDCAVFDISLGCSGYVYGLSVIINFMQGNGLSKGLLFTSDPYSKILNKEDKNTSLLFGDAATVSYITETPKLVSNKFNFGSIGKEWQSLNTLGGNLEMNGRAIFNFAARYVPKDIDNLLQKNNITHTDIDLYIFHQGSKYIVDTITKKVRLPEDKVIFDAATYGNTVSSSIPIILNKYMNMETTKTILISGFGVGLSWASTILKRS